MKYTIPNYYNQFHCIAGKCPATCCAGWQIVIDDNSLTKYRSLETTLGNRLNNSIDWKNSTFLQYDGRCAFLDENNLCDLYTEAGPDMLCRTCRRYPRHVEEFQNEREISLSLSCPVAANLILGWKEKASFLSKQDMREEKEDENFDFFLYSALQDTRSRMIEILQDRENSIGFRMAKVLALAHDVQNRIDSRHLFETEALLQRYSRKDADEKLHIRFQKYVNFRRSTMVSRELLNLLSELEVLNPAWILQLGKWEDTLDHAAYDRECLFDNGESLSGGVYIAPGTECEQLMVYFLYTYFCGAVYDGDALSKVKMAVVSTAIVLELEKACRMDVGRSLQLEDRARIVWNYSRELEHSDLNLNHMEYMMRVKEAASFENLLTICCSSFNCSFGTE